MSGTIGILGGSGLYDLADLATAREETLTTPFGDPSDAYRVGDLAGRPVAFLARHGRGHCHLPGEINYRANILGFKMLGCDAVLSVSAVGSLKEELAPEQVVIPDQFIDRTRHRADTFFGGGVVGHVSLADPVCSALASALACAAESVGARVTSKGTYVCMEGPQFSTRAESDLYRSWGADVIGMTNLTEARLAREAEICYATMALVTDYDCWRDATEPVAIETVLGVLRANAETAQRALLDAVGRIDDSRSCGCREALKFAVITDPKRIPPEARERLALLIGKSLS